MKKTVVEACLVLDVHKLNEKRIFQQGLPWSGWVRWSRGDTVEVHGRYPANSEYDLILTPVYRNGDDNIEYDIPIISTPCHFGGKRYWFICPGVKDGMTCRRRAGKLYQPRHAKYFLCRHCHNLSYKSRQEWKSVTQFGLALQTLKILDKLEQVEKEPKKGRSMEHVQKRMLKLAELAKIKGRV